MGSCDTSHSISREGCIRNMGVLLSGSGGTRFGSGPTMLPPSSSRLESHAPRRRDRRRGFSELLAVVVRNLEKRGDGSFMRSAFEDTLRRVVPVRSVQLRDAATRWTASEAQGAEVIALEVPGS